MTRVARTVDSPTKTTAWREGKSGPAAMVAGSASAVATVTTPRIPAHAVTVVSLFPTGVASVLQKTRSALPIHTTPKSHTKRKKMSTRMTAIASFTVEASSGSESSTSVSSNPMNTNTRLVIK